MAAPPSLGPRVEPPRRVQSGWERNALGCGAAATLGNRRSNSHIMDSNDPYLHLSKSESVVSSGRARRGAAAFSSGLEANAFASWRLRRDRRPV